MRPFTLPYSLAGLLLLALASRAVAGMPAPLPTNVEQVLRLNAPAAERFQAISFFVVCLLLAVGAVQLLWNYLRRDFPRLPRLGYGRALAGVLLWGLLFVVVLTMISGARELMTPGAWEKQGFIYKLPVPPAAALVDSDPARARREQLDRLKTALWQFAATHGGHFPDAATVLQIPADLWDVPGGGGLRFSYRPGLTAAKTMLLVYGPELEVGRRLVLRTDGTIAEMPSAEVEATLREVKP